MNETQPKHAGNMFDAMRKALESIPAEVRVEAQKAEDDFQSRMQNGVIETLRAQSNWPVRHAQTEKLNAGGEWGLQFEKLRTSIGTGFLTTLTGTRGNGKTQLAVELIRFVTGNERTARFCTAIQFFMAIKSTYKKDSERTEADVIKEFRKPSFLVIDEIGRRGETEWENNLLFEVLNWRYNDRKDTLLLCNLTPQELQANLGPSLISRLNESGGMVQCNWESFR